MARVEPMRDARTRHLPVGPGSPGDAGLPGDAELPGDSGVWTFIIADLMGFAMFFLVFSAGRVASPGLFEQSRRHLDSQLGLVNTIILLTSSLFMVQAVHAARRGDRGATLRHLVLTMVMGMGFAVVKMVEYSAKASAGVTMLTNEFFTYYFVFTGIHFLHVIIGLAALGMMVGRARRDPLNARFMLWIESVGSYWHMVDLLWIMLFPALYLMHAA
ncbi:MAG: cytochrome c oxidase subunit 3 family protein [Sphingopyxis sp.]